MQITHPDLTPPAMPIGLTVQTDTLGHITLSWRANQDTDLNGYFVYRGLANTGDNYAQLQLKPQRATTFRDTLLRNNQNLFFYRVVAVDKNENESLPALLTVRLPDNLPPPTPRMNGAVAEADSVRLSWQISSADDVRTYYVLRRTEGDNPAAFKIVGRTATMTFTDRQLPGGLYSYAIQALDSMGNVSKPSLPRLLDVAGKIGLDVPKGVTARLNEREKKLLVSWTPSPRSANFVGYRVLARETDDTFRAVTPLLAETQAELTNWQAGTDIDIAVVVIGQNGQQLRSETVKATTRH